MRKEKRSRADKIREEAEKRLSAPAGAVPADDYQRLIHELQVHQIELEMQNEELRRVQQELEESGAKYLDLYDFSPTGYLTVNESGRILEANLTASKQLGIERSRVVGSSFPLYITPEDRNVFRRHLEQVFKAEEPQSCEIKLLVAGGGEFHAMLRSIVVPHSDGYNSTRTSVTDISDRRLMEEALHKREERFRRTFDQSPIGAAIVSLDYRFQRVNAELCHITGYSEEELLSLGFPDITHPEDRGNDVEKANRLVAGEIDHFQTDQRYIRKDGDIVWVRLFVRVVHDAFGQPLYFLSMLENITDRKRNEEELDRYRQHLEDLVAERTARLKEANEQLQQMVSECKRAETALIESENRYRTIFETAGTAMALASEDTTITLVNTEFEKLCGCLKEEIEGKKSWEEFFLRDDLDRMHAHLRLRKEDSNTKPRNLELRLIAGEGNFRDVFSTLAAIPQTRLNVLSLLDITELKQQGEALRGREAELEIKSLRLEEVNAALRVLLRRIEGDKKELEKNVWSNVKELILPYVERLKLSRLEPDQRICLDILEANLGGIVSAFIGRLSPEFLRLTPMEVKIANLIKEGKTSQEIAGVLNVSENTVISHRYHIRHKLGLSGKKVNLKSYLRSLYE